MNTSIVDDALKLCVYIFNAIPPNDTWAIVNIARTDNPRFHYPSVTEIPWSFGYTFDAVPKFLREEGVIEAWHPNKWFTLVGLDTSMYKTSDEITIISRKKGYLKKNQSAQYYYKFSSYNSDLSPKAAGHYAILVNKAVLNSFYNKYTPKQSVPTLPTFDLSSGELHFLGEKLVFDGELKKRTLDLLIKNINSRVSYKEMYDVRGNANYDSLIAGKGNTKQPHDAVDQVWKDLKRKVESNKKMNNCLVFVQNDGFAIFADQRNIQVSLVPQKTPQKEASDTPKVA